MPMRWADLDVRPHERVAVMRLLVCVAQAAIGAPEDSDGWAGFGDDLSERVLPYLDRWREAFELFGRGSDSSSGGRPRTASRRLPAS